MSTNWMAPFIITQTRTEKPMLKPITQFKDLNLTGKYAWYESTAEDHQVYAVHRATGHIYYVDYIDEEIKMLIVYGVGFITPIVATNLKSNPYRRFCVGMMTDPHAMAHSPIPAIDKFKPQFTPIVMKDELELRTRELWDLFTSLPEDWHTDEDKAPPSVMYSAVVTRQPSN